MTTHKQGDPITLNQLYGRSQGKLADLRGAT